VAACLVLANCASSGKFAGGVDPKYGVSSSPRVVAFGDPVPKGGGTYRVGKPYTVAGQVYVPEEDTHYRAEGLASWYGDDFHGRLTANGEVFDMASLTAAHPTLPMPCYARVTNLSNGKSLVVRVNDRGPYHGNRVMDVSSRAAELLEFKGNGTARVRVEYVGRAPLEGSDDRQLIATLRTGVPAPSPSATRRRIRPRYQRHRKCPRPPACVRAVGFSKTRAPCPTKTMVVMPPAPGRFPPMRRSTRMDRANCWPGAGSIEPVFRGRYPPEKQSRLR
jgi:rare lipoprotein A (peptidoglycan hydrolase)